MHYNLKSSFAYRLITEKHALTRLATVRKKGLILPLEIPVFVVLLVGTGFLTNSLPLYMMRSLTSAERVRAFMRTVPGTFVGMAMSIGMIVMFMLYCRLIQKRPARSMGFQKERTLSEVPKGILVGFLLFSAAVLLGSLFGGFRFDGVAPQIALPAIGLWILRFFVEGMKEEVMLRGCFMVSISRRSPMWVAVLVNSVVFGAAHCLNPGIGVLPVVNLTLFGIFASLYMLRTGSIWSVAAMHAVWNIAQGNVYGLTVSGQDVVLPTLLHFSQTGRALVNGGVFGPEGGIAVTAVLLAGTAVLLLAPIKSQEVFIKG